MVLIGGGCYNEQTFSEICTKLCHRMQNLTTNSWGYFSCFLIPSKVRFCKMHEGLVAK